MKGLSEYLEDAYLTWLSPTMACCAASDDRPIRRKLRYSNVWNGKLIAYRYGEAHED
jgi:hypothetical protein